MARDGYTRGILLSVLDVTREAVLPLDVCLQELSAILREVEPGDLEAGLQAWAVTVKGAILPSDRPIAQVMGQHAGQPGTDPEARAAMALRLASVRGKVRASELQAIAPGLSPETYRATFAALVRAGQLRKHGNRKTTYYTLA